MGLAFTIMARSRGPKLTPLGSAASMGMYSCAPSHSPSDGFSAARFASAMASVTASFRPASLKSRVVEPPCRLPARTVIDSWRSY